MSGIPEALYGTPIFELVDASQAEALLNDGLRQECVQLDFDTGQITYSNLNGSNLEIQLPFESALDLLKQAELSTPSGPQRETLLESKLTKRLMEEAQTAQPAMRLGR
ncbi:MAG: hypothetical protein HFG20_00930 [Anaerotruncus sp.]|nr:hypothetical protein [Anaerotruncus sp.]